MPAQYQKEKQNSGANPAPLGLLGFGLSTVLLNLINADLIPAAGLGMVLAMAIFYGGIIQIIVGILEFKRGSTFGTVAFSSYGAFWLSLAAIHVLPGGAIAAVDSVSIGAYLIMWGVFSIFMFVGTLKLNRGLQVVFSSLVVLFFLLGIADITDSATLKVIGGIEGIFVGASAIYVAGAEILNEMYGKKVLPL